ncbi:hypothetical protein AAMO2058_001318000 [Amorphochlora amoebiformis]
MAPPLFRRANAPRRSTLVMYCLALTLGIASLVVGPKYFGSGPILGSGSSPSHELQTVRIKVENTTLPQDIPLDLPRGFYVSSITVLPFHETLDDIPIVEWYDHTVSARMVYENGRAAIRVASRSPTVDSRAELDYLMVYVSLTNDQRHEVASSVFQVGPTSDFALPVYVSIVPLNSSIPRRGMTVLPLQIQDENPHIQTWDGLVADYIPVLNVYAVTIPSKIPADKNDMVGFVEQFGAPTYGAASQATSAMYKSKRVSLHADSIDNYDETDSVTLTTDDLGGSPCDMYPWDLFKCSPVITSVMVLPMIVKDYQMNPIPCTKLTTTANAEGSVTISGMQACMDEADALEFSVEEWQIYLTYSMFPSDRRD